MKIKELSENENETDYVNEKTHKKLGSFDMNTYYIQFNDPDSYYYHENQYEYIDENNCYPALLSYTITCQVADGNSFSRINIDEINDAIVNMQAFAEEHNLHEPVLSLIPYMEY